MKARARFAVSATTILAALLVSGTVAAQHHNKHDERALRQDPRLAPGQIAPVLEGLGVHHHPVTTKSERAQLFFDQGLKLPFLILRVVFHIPHPIVQSRKSVPHQNMQ